MPPGELLEVETTLEPPAPDLPANRRKRLPRWATVREAGVFLAFTVFFLVYGLTPLLGGDGLGLVGADEPRYAQIAHEMLVRFDSAAHPEGPPERLRHPLSLRPSLAGEAGSLLLAGDVFVSGLRRA